MERRAVCGPLPPASGYRVSVRVDSASTPARPDSVCRCLPLRMVLLLVFLAGGSAARADDTLPLWQLTSGQIFEVDSSTHRITEMRIGDSLTVSDITDRVSLQYLMLRHDRHGAAHLEVRIKAMERTVRNEDGEVTTEELSPEQLLRVTGLTMIVANQGQSVELPDGAFVFRSDVPQIYRALRQMGEDGVLESWFDLPFRVPVLTARPPFRVPAASPSADDESSTPESSTDESVDDPALHVDSEWSRTQSIALGLAAMIRCDCRYRMESIEGLQGQIRVTGSADVVPRDSRSDSPLKFQDVQISASELTGSGSIRVDELSGLPRSIQMSQQMLLEGQLQVESGDQQHQMQFKQSLTQTWNASEFRLQDLQRGVPVTPTRGVR